MNSTNAALQADSKILSTAIPAVPAMQEPRTSGPLATALVDAIGAAARAELAWVDCECAECECAECRYDARRCAAYVQSIRADEAVVLARQALVASDEEIEWDVSEEGNCYGTVWASSAVEALEMAIVDFDASCYGDVDETFRVAIRVRNDLIDEADSGTVTIDPPAPDCADGCDHQWWTPHSVVGGDRSNPGVWSSGHGGVRCKGVCLHCGSYRIVDGGGTDPSDGTQLRTTRYEAADDASLAWIAERAEMAEQAEEEEEAEAEQA